MAFLDPGPVFKDSCTLLEMLFFTAQPNALKLCIPQCLKPIWIRSLRSSGLGTVCHIIGALKIRIGFWGPLHYNYDQAPPPQKKKKTNKSIGKNAPTIISRDLAVEGLIHARTRLEVWPRLGVSLTLPSPTRTYLLVGSLQKHF